MKKSPDAVLVQVAKMKLDPWTIPPRQVLAGKPRASGKLLDGDGRCETGVWECTPGSFVWNYDTHQSVCVVSGKAEVVVGRKVLKLVPGSAVFLRAGTQARWTVTKTLRKLYTLYY